MWAQFWGKTILPDTFCSPWTTGYTDTAIGTLLTKETVRKRIRTENRNYESKIYATSLSIALPICFFSIREITNKNPKCFPIFFFICFIRVLSFFFLPFFSALQIPPFKNIYLTGSML